MFEALSSIGGFCLFLIFTGLIAIAYQLVLRHWFYFSDRNVKFLRGAPLLGTNYKSIIGIEPVAIAYRRCYERFSKNQFCGTYKFGGRPSYLIRNPDLIKQIFVSDADHFDNESDLCAHLFETPATLFGNGMQSLHPLMVKCSETFVESIKKTTKIAKMFDSYDLFTRYANDVNAEAIFGIELNSLHVAADDNEVLKASRLLSEFQYIDSLKFLLSSSIPLLSKVLNVQEKDAKSAESLREIVEIAINARGNNDSAVYNDMYSLLKKVKNNELKFDTDNINIGFAALQEPSNATHDGRIQSRFRTILSKFRNELTAKTQYFNIFFVLFVRIGWTDDDIIAHCLRFSRGSMNTITKTACFMFHELAMHPDVQNKLYIEISDMKTQLNGSPLTYETIPKLPYLDMVVCETLRRWPTFAFFERVCNRPYVLANSNDTKVELQSGDSVTIPTYALHMVSSSFSTQNQNRVFLISSYVFLIIFSLCIHRMRNISQNQFNSIPSVSTMKIADLFGPVLIYRLAWDHVSDIEYDK